MDDPGRMSSVGRAFFVKVVVSVGRWCQVKGIRIRIGLPPSFFKRDRGIELVARTGSC